jgi:alpha-L-rhamnosidase
MVVKIMRKYLTIGILLLYSASGFSQINTAKPWAYWWWMGSAVTKEGISKNLKDYSKAGFGGMHIIPIYGVKGEEANFIPYLSPKWFEMLDFTLIEAKKNGLGIDMTLGSGWPFGGPQVLPADAAKGYKIINENNALKLVIEPTKQNVKRAAPGGEGFVIDHFSKQAVTNYLEPFQKAFSNKNYPVRAFYNDSYEAYGANWTPDFFEKFKTLRGYNLSDHLEVLNLKQTNTEQEKRITSDYHETLSDLLFNEFNPTWINFSKKFGKKTRDEAHGSPANILDLYAQADMPESEFFGSKPYDIPFYRQDPDYEESRFGTPGTLILKMASSAANVAGKPLVSSETATWLGNHFKVSLSQIKPIIDESFIGGINHVFFHGMPYTPPEAPFPGWLFYASTNFNQNSHFWKELPLLNKYIENCQNRLQTSLPNNDILVYFPIYDLWTNVGPNGKTHAINVHTLLKDEVFKGGLGKLSNELIQNGYTFDYISDLQLLNSKSDKTGAIISQANQKYKTIIIPKSTYFSLKTLKQLAFFKNNGAQIIFESQLPSKVNGFYNWESRQAEFTQIIPQFEKNKTDNILEKLAELAVRNETLSQKGLSFIRKKTKTGCLYFISNLSNNFHENTISLNAMAKSVKIIDPLNNTFSSVPFEILDKKSISIALPLLAGQSVFVETFDAATNIKLLKIKKSVPKKFAINTNWQVDFIQGNPYLPNSYKTNTLKSWTENADTSANYFSGRAKYTAKFSFPTSAATNAAFINLGDVRESAKVTINGQKIGVAWCLPFRLAIPKGVLKTENTIEIEVTNLSANRIHFMDLKQIPWKKFYDINMVDIGYKPFDASKWTPVESGLLSEITIEY